MLRINDSAGLYLQLFVNGGQTHGWRFTYTAPVTGKRNILSFGTYPDTTLDALARMTREVLAITFARIRDIEIDEVSIHAVCSVVFK